jgi:UDP-2,3-diacylglucosamine pyrophosphatase LpxH
MPTKVEALFISDIHLGSKGSNSAELIELFKMYEFDKLFIVGDFIDGWLLKKRFFWKSDFTKLIRKLLSLSKDGVEIVYVIGNHDEFFREYLPITIEPNIKLVNEYQWNGYFITHGDLYDGVIKLRWLAILGSWGYEFAIIVDRFIKKFGVKKSLSKYLKDKVKHAIKFILDFEKQLAYQANKRGLNGVICGHIHTPVDKVINIDDDYIHYLNCGDWIENNSYIIYDGEFKVKKFSK